MILYKLMRPSLWILSKSFDKSLTFAFFSGTLFHNKAALLNEICYIALFVRSAASLNHFAAIHPRQNLLVPRSLFLFERFAAATGLQFFIRTLTTASAVRTGYSAMTSQKCGRAWQRRCKTGAGTWSGVNGEQSQTLPFTFTLPCPVLKTCIHFWIWIFKTYGKSKKQVSTRGHNFTNWNWCRTLWSYLLGSAFPKPCSTRSAWFSAAPSLST